MCPLCSPPSRLPAPRSSRSSAAILNPAPRSLNSFSAASLRRARLAQVAIRRNQQVSIRATIGTPHPPAQLVELRQAMPVGAIDDDGVTEWDVEPVLDDRRRHQDIGLVPHEGEHDAFQFALRHLAVANQDASFGHHLAQLAGDVVDAFHAIVHEVNLPATLQFFLDGRAQQFFIPRRDHSLDRHAIFGRQFRSRSCRASRAATCAGCAESASPTW